MDDKKIKQKTTPEGHVYHYEGEEELVKDPKENSKKLKEKWSKIKEALLNKKADFIDIIEEEKEPGALGGEGGGESILEPEAISDESGNDDPSDGEELVGASTDVDTNEEDVENVEDGTYEMDDEDEGEDEDSDFSDFLDEYFKASEDSSEDSEATTDEEKIEYLKSLGYNSEEIKQFMGVPANRGFGDDNEADWSKFNSESSEDDISIEEEEISDDGGEELEEDVVEEEATEDEGSDREDGNKKESPQKNKTKEKPKKKEEKKKGSVGDDDFRRKIIEKFILGK